MLWNKVYRWISTVLLFIHTFCIMRNPFVWLICYVYGYFLHEKPIYWRALAKFCGWGILRWFIDKMSLFRVILCLTLNGSQGFRYARWINNIIGCIWYLVFGHEIGKSANRGPNNPRYAHRSIRRKNETKSDFLKYLFWQILR